MRAVAVVLFAAFAALAHAWGPASHYYFTCSARGVPLAECFQHKDLLSGTEMPDAFGFGAMLSPVGVPVQPGQGWQYLGLHSPVFAGYLYKNADKYNTATFNATEFAIGFGMHVSADAAGFYDKGYLGYGWGQHDAYEPLVDTNTMSNWLGLWPFMESVDAYVAATRFAPLGQRLPTDVAPSASNETAAFVVATIEAAAADGVSFPAANQSVVVELAKMWQSLVAEESIKVDRTPAASYGWEMQYNDRYGAKSAGEAQSHFEIVARCAVKAAATWHEAIAAPSSTPASALQAMFGYVTGAYAKGECQPATATAAPPQRPHRS